MLGGLPVSLVQKESSFDMIRKIASQALKAYTLSERCYKTVIGRIRAIYKVVGPEGENVAFGLWPQATFLTSGPTIHMLPPYPVNNCAILQRKYQT